MGKRDDITQSRIVIVGAGPVGSILALELARHNVPCTVVERSTAAPLFPKMDYINGRSMELLRRLGLAEPIREGGVDRQHSSDFLWIDSLPQPPVAVWRQESPAAKQAAARKADEGTAPLEPYLRIAGALLEELLRRRLRDHPDCTVLEGWTFESLRRRDDGVTAVIASGSRTRELAAEYLVGCDGAGSAVRAAAGIESEFADQPSERCSVYFRSGDPVLRRWGRAFITTSSRGIALVSRDEKELWTASFPVDPDEAADIDPVAVMREKLGADFAVDEVLSVNRWHGALSVAERYRSGRVFLAGDSAHRFYPFGGHGANTGIADAVDLGWKLAAVLGGWGGAALLDSYEAERRPVALFNREMSANLLEVWRRYARMSADGASRAHRAGFLAKEAYQADNTGVHFGYRYEGSPVIAAEEGEAPQWDWTAIVPSTWPGGRPPSIRLGDGTALFDAFGTGFTLVDMSQVDTGKALVARAVERGIPMTHLAVDDADVRDVWQRDLVLVRPDQHVAWRGNHAPANPDALLDLVTGAPTRTDEA
ncbi:FAD-dependent monooxygenase [Glycomyces sp. TRM65418]|uniref:FAD-dependent monooxygenase n=1 Tax=Glycomyces sp. TRM65418 TaxID=2867006 RepID=UPI001CE64EA5|nr:FAD-dependent monooxygenase [Glycomyces sp. TRM65418]MCC3761592.1 FAD-dependent monooxygenase [Glycomyces sp. TRM65418]QZD55687.1 FAD-dependent monooxygenase [Glycomyces sp. TRM65418]